MADLTRLIPDSGFSADARRDRALAIIADAMPDGWQAPVGGPLWTQEDAHGQEADELEQKVALASIELFASAVLEQIHGILRVQGQRAVATTTWQLDHVPTSGLVLPAGYVLLRTGDLVWATVDDVTIAQDATQLTDVRVQATAAGTTYNGQTGDLAQITLLPMVARVTLDEETEGGSDPESVEDHVRRGQRELRHAGRPTLPEDFAAKARNDPAVGRALAIPNYVPAIGDEPERNDVPRAMAIAVHGPAGEVVGDAVLQRRADAIAAEREPNWIVTLFNAPRTPITAFARIDFWPGTDQAAALQAADAAIVALLDPGQYGAPPEPPEDPDADLEWNDEPIVLWDEVMTAVQTAHKGVRHVHELLLNGAKQDVALAGPAGLPDLTAHGVTPWT